MIITILVVDDEPLARRKLSTLISAVPWARQIGEAGDGVSAVEEIKRLQPDIVFLDIQMPELTGIQVVEQLRWIQPMPAVVFTTAYDQYAVTAFELEAVDYLLKPFGTDRFNTALERARHLVETNSASAYLDRARTALNPPGSTIPQERIFVRDGKSVIPLALSVIERFEAQGDYVMIHTGGKHYLVGLRIVNLESWLPNPPFLRVHRSHIVNLDHVERMLSLDDSRLEVLMKSSMKVPVSRARSQEIRRRSR